MSLSDWKKGDKLEASHLQETVTALRKMGYSDNGENTSVNRVGGGVFTNGKSTPLNGFVYWGKIVVAGYSGEADYTDARYHVKVQVLAPTGNHLEPVEMGDGSSVAGEVVNLESSQPDYLKVVTVYNMAEYKDETHLLTVDSVVYFWGETEDADTTDTKPVFRWVMDASPPGGFFPVTVIYDGGVQGDKGSAATWTYTVSSLAGAELGTVMTPLKGRPFGRTVAGGGYGSAFYHAGILKLWDAGEIYGTGGCVPA